ncbi:MAG TPA: MGMT family protein [Patescibacteria group bacterium]|nr:MGMT family protein [Patescibacteria group bacterium]
MASLRFGRVDGPLGPMWVAETDAGVAAVSREDSPSSMLAGLGRRFPGVDAVADRVDGRWGAGGPPPALDVRGLSAFDARVYEVVRTVPAGETVTYGEVAARIGSPGAARAVGGAMARCPYFPLVPCHRVVRAADGWSGWGGDDRLKRRLLEAERAAATSRTVRMPS